MNINHQAAVQWRNSEYVQQVRQSFLDDQRHPGCKRCWDLEDQGFTSLRQRTAQEYEILKVDVAQSQLTNLEVDMTNLCNLKCLMCNEHGSSAILAENQQLGINKISQDQMKWSDQAFENLQDLLLMNPKVVNIRGGEPLYIKPLLDIVERFPEDRAQSMILHITTNATLWNERWKLALSKFKLVRFMFSVDATDSLYEYMRYPSKWDLVQHNIQQIMALPNARCLVHAVLQNLNVSLIGNLVQWCQQRSLWLNLDILDHPDYMKLTNLTDQQRRLAMDHLNYLIGLQPSPHLQKTFMQSLKLLEQSKFDSDQWNQFVTNISQRDRLRGNTFQNFLC